MALANILIGSIQVQMAADGAGVVHQSYELSEFQSILNALHE